MPKVCCGHLKNDCSCNCVDYNLCLKKFEDVTLRYNGVAIPKFTLGE